jgi:hypothetical protein
MADYPAVTAFSGHETFPVRYAWLKKGVDATAADSGVFRSDEAMVTLGVGKNMVKSIRHWCLATGVLEELPGSSGRPSGHFRVTEFGRALFGDDGWDPYLEDPATLWLLHWQIASNVRRCTTWYWAFSHFHEPEFTREALVAALLSWVQTAKSPRVTRESLSRDVECFFRTYVPSRRSKQLGLEETLDCPLVELGLIRTVGEEGVFQFHRGAQVPDGVLFFSILTFWDGFAPAASVLSIQDVARQPGSPGQLFKLDEHLLAERCLEIGEWTEGVVTYNETAGLRQLYRRQAIKPVEILDRMYKRAGILQGGLR